MRIALQLVSVALIAIAAQAPIAAEEARPFYLGFTPFSWDDTEEASANSWALVSAHSDLIAHHIEGGVPWPEALADEPFSKHLQDDWESRRKNTPSNAKVYLALTPTNRSDLAPYHGEKENMPLPAGWEDKPFNDPDVMKAYLNYCRRGVAFFDPDYLAIGIEVNELRNASPEMWPGYVEMHRYVYDALKKEHPDLPVFATLTLHSLLKTEWSTLEEQRKDIQDFLQYNDIAGISFYSFIKTISDPAKPDDAFQWLHDFVGDKQIAICETGYPSKETVINSEMPPLPGSPEKQVSYYQTLFKYAHEKDYLFVVTFLIRDYDALWEKIKAAGPDWFISWLNTGLFNGDGSEKPALAVWDQQFKRPYARD